MKHPILRKKNLTFYISVFRDADFSGNSKTITSDHFEGGNITALFGGAKLDFGQAKLAQGENVLDVFSMFKNY